MPEALWRLTGAGLGRGAARRLAPTDLRIDTGVTALLGHSGAGKTSLCELLVGFAKPDVGAIDRFAPERGRLPLYWAGEGGLWPQLGARAHLMAVAPRSPWRSADEWLAAFDLAAVADASPTRLSAGERARLAVARALASEAAVLVLDEPFANVDPARAAICWDELFAVARARGQSLVYSTHVPERVLGCADAVVCLRQGAVIAGGAVDGVYARPATPEVAECFGPANWLAGEERRRWLGDDAGHPCVRPERLAIVPDQRGPATVLASRFHGAVASADLALESGARRRFLHRPAQALPLGGRVALRVLAAATLALAMTGCGDAGATLALAQSRTWTLPPVEGSQPAPRGMAVDRAGELLVLDTVGRVLVYGRDGALARQWWMPAHDVGRPEGIVELKDGRLAVADTHYHRVVFFDRVGAVVGMLGSEGEGPSQFQYPVAVTTDDDGDLYVSEYGGNDRVQEFAPDGSWLRSFGGFGTARERFQRPQALAWRGHRLYVADALNDRVQVFDDHGPYVGVLGEGAVSLKLPYGLTLAPDGAIDVAEWGAERVTRIAADGKLIGRFGHAGRGSGELSTPWNLAAAGDGRVWVADTGNRRIVELAP